MGIHNDIMCPFDEDDVRSFPKWENIVRGELYWVVQVINSKVEGVCVIDVLNQFSTIGIMSYRQKNWEFCFTQYAKFPDCEANFCNNISNNFLIPLLFAIN